MPSDQELESLARLLGAALLARGHTVASAESCTGGWIGKTLTDVPGSSAWFGWGFVTYANEAKTGTLGVSEQTLIEHGAVSEPVVVAMAKGAREQSGAEFSVAVSGVAGPSGGTADKPVGTVWFAWAGPDTLQAQCRQFSGDREAVRRQTVAHGLKQLLKVVEAGA